MEGTRQGETKILKTPRNCAGKPAWQPVLIQWRLRFPDVSVKLSTGKDLWMQISSKL